jgi:hypothetical protein
MPGTRPGMTSFIWQDSILESALAIEGDTMNIRLSSPRRETFLVSIVIAILVVLGMIVPLPFFTGYALGLLLIAYLILLAGVLLDNL